MRGVWLVRLRVRIVRCHGCRAPLAVARLSGGGPPPRRRPERCGACGPDVPAAGAAAPVAAPAAPCLAAGRPAPPPCALWRAWSAAAAAAPGRRGRTAGLPRDGPGGRPPDDPAHLQLRAGLLPSAWRRGDTGATFTPQHGAVRPMLRCVAAPPGLSGPCRCGVGVVVVGLRTSSNTAHPPPPPYTSRGAVGLRAHRLLY